MPSAYNNNAHLFQTPDHVVIVNQMVHNARVVPLSGEPHLRSRSDNGRAARSSSKRLKALARRASSDRVPTSS